MSAARPYTVVLNSFTWTIEAGSCLSQITCGQGTRLHPQARPQLVQRSRRKMDKFCLWTHQAASHAKAKGLEGQTLISETGTLQNEKSPLETRVDYVFLWIYWRSIQLCSTHSLLHKLNLALHKLPSARCP